jgi:hypothetical protein
MNAACHRTEHITSLDLAIARRLRAAPDSADKPTVPMPGGHGTYFLDSRHFLGNPYLLEYSAETRAYYVLRLIGDRDGSSSDWIKKNQWIARNMKHGLVHWLRHFGMISGPQSDWNYMATGFVGALATLVSDLSRPGTHLYRARVQDWAETATRRLTATKQIERVTKVSDQGRYGRRNSTTLTAIPDKVVPQETSTRLLLRYFLYRLHSSLAVPYVEQLNMRERGKPLPAYGCILALLRRIASREYDRAPPQCSPMAARLLPEMTQIDAFGGWKRLSCDESPPGTEVPGYFQPYRGGTPITRQDVMSEVAGLLPEMLTDMEAAHLLAVLMADMVIDPLHAWRRYAIPSELGRVVYAFLYNRQRYEQTRARTASARSEDQRRSTTDDHRDRRQLNSLYKELSAERDGLCSAVAALEDDLRPELREWESSCRPGRPTA